MWPNPQETVDLATFTEEVLNGKLHFCALLLITWITMSKFLLITYKWRPVQFSQNAHKSSSEGVDLTVFFSTLNKDFSQTIFNVFIKFHIFSEPQSLFMAQQDHINFAIQNIVFFAMFAME